MLFSAVLGVGLGHFTTIYYTYLHIKTSEIFWGCLTSSTFFVIFFCFCRKGAKRVHLPTWIDQNRKGMYSITQKRENAKQVWVKCSLLLLCSLIMFNIFIYYHVWSILISSDFSMCFNCLPKCHSKIFQEFPRCCHSLLRCNSTFKSLSTTSEWWILRHEIGNAHNAHLENGARDALQLSRTFMKSYEILWDLMRSYEIDFHLIHFFVYDILSFLKLKFSYVFITEYCGTLQTQAFDRYLQPSVRTLLWAPSRQWQSFVWLPCGVDPWAMSVTCFLLATFAIFCDTNYIMIYTLDVK